MRKVDEFWADYFGCSTEDLDEPTTLVLPHAALQGYEGILAFRHGPSCIVSVPPTVPEIERRKLRGSPPDRAFDPGMLAKSFVVWEEQVSRPAWVGVCDRADFRPIPSSARMLTSDDADAIRQLGVDCGEVPWNATEFYLRSDPTFGIFAGGELVAAAGYVVMGGAIAYVGIGTRPEHRGRGYAKAAVSAAMEFAFDQHLVPLWRADAANDAALAVARSLGFRPYAFTIDVRLTQEVF